MSPCSSLGHDGIKAVNSGRAKKFHIGTEQFYGCRRFGPLGSRRWLFGLFSWTVFMGREGAGVMQQRPEKPDKKVKGQSVKEESPTQHGPQIDPELQVHIGRHLKASYDDILAQDVPDRFVQLLRQLEEKTKGAPPKGKG